MNDVPCLNIRGPDHLYYCQISDCGKRFSKLKNFEAHKLIHTGGRPFPCTVKGCAAAYTRRQHLARHIKITHKKTAGAYPCTAKGCVSTFDSQESLSQHHRRVHFGSKLAEADEKLRCLICKEDFPSLTKLRSHNASAHPMQCALCSQVFYNESKFNYHFAFHKRQEKKRSTPKKCDLCNIEVENWSSLAEHKKTDKHLALLAEKLTCPVCHKSFALERNFRDHKRTHESERPLFSCTYTDCKKSYYFLKNLRHHIKLVHERNINQLPKCSICDKNFCSKTKLKSHVRVIHGPDYSLRESKETSVTDSREEIVKSLAGKLKCSGRALFRVKRPPGKTKKVIEENGKKSKIQFN